MLESVGFVALPPIKFSVKAAGFEPTDPPIKVPPIGTLSNIPGAAGVPG